MPLSIHRGQLLLNCITAGASLCNRLMDVMGGLVFIKQDLFISVTKVQQKYHICKKICKNFTKYLRMSSKSSNFASKIEKMR